MADALAIHWVVGVCFECLVAIFKSIFHFSVIMPPKKDDNKARFIEAVRELPFLYDLKDEDYKNKTKVDEKWTELATDFNYTGTEFF